MVESELGLLKVQRKCVFGNPVELSQAMFGVTPKGFNSIDVFRAPDELIVAVINLEMSINANVHKPIVAAPFICMDHAVRVDLAADNCLQRSFGCIWDDFGVNAVAPFKKTKDDCFATSTASSFTPNAFGAEVRLVDFEIALKWGLSSTGLGHARADTLVNGVGAAKRQTRQLGCISGRQIKRKKAYQLTKLSFADFRTVVVPIFPISSKS